MEINRTKRILLAVVFVICFSGVANAQCAWVLWEKSTSRNHHDDKPWQLWFAYPQYEQCMEAGKIGAEEVEKRYKKNAGDNARVSRFGGTGYIYPLDEDDWILMTAFRCFPDTIDPRK